MRAFELASGKPVSYKVAARRAGDIAACYADPAQAWALLSHGFVGSTSVDWFL